MRFLYEHYLNRPADDSEIRKPPNKKHKKVDMEEIADERNKIGKISEEFALRWEKRRLIGLSRPKLVGQIKDCRETPSIGYDFSSFESSGEARLIAIGTGHNG